jgi:2-polyprenyl-3-methyl-5-hydroxy-6-metoxy-1,4-benzoquinol methylase
MQCLFCKSSNISNTAFPRATLFNNKIFHYKKCRDCGLVFIDPLPEGDDYDKMYSNSYHDQFYFKDSGWDYTPVYNLIEPHIQAKNIMDYGCGDGSFIKFFLKRGYRCTGVEYDPQLVQRLKEEIPEADFYTVEEFRLLLPEKKFDAIYVGDVLEHMTAPSLFIKRLANRLETNGILVAEGPLENNTTLSLFFRKFSSAVAGLIKGNGSHVPYHIFFSNAGNQEDIFKNNGLSTLAYNVFETPWPLPSKFDWKPLRATQFLIGKTSVFFSKLLPGKIGNRFMYVGKK